jgi:hypothetical protein
LKSISLVFFVLLAEILFCQSYNTSIGIRLGDDYALSVTQRIFNHSTIEATHQDGLFSGVQRTTILWRQHTPIVTRRFNFFIGIGAHRTIHQAIPEYAGLPTFGAAFTLGSEITIGRLNLALDMSPTYLLSKNSNARFDSTSGVSLHYVLWKRKSQFATFISKLKFW